MRYAQIEREAYYRPARLEIIDIAEIVPQAQRYCRKQQPPSPAAVVFYLLISILSRLICCFFALSHNFALREG
jgi:hypothetical protein